MPIFTFNKSNLLTILVVICCILVVFFMSLVLLQLKPYEIQYSDVRSFYTGGLLVREDIRSDFYSIDTQFSIQKSLLPFLTDPSQLIIFNLPPPVALLYLPFTFFPFISAYYSIFAMNVLLVILSIYLITSSLLNTASLKVKLYFMLFTLTFLPTWEVLFSGQTSFFLLIAVTATYILLIRQKDITAGMLFSILFIRFNLLILPVFIFIWKRWYKMIVGISIGILFYLVVSLSLVGIKGLVQYWTLLVFLLQAGDVYAIHPELEPTLRGFWHNILGTPHFNSIIFPWLLSVLASIFLLLKYWKSEFKFRPEALIPRWSVLLIIIILTSVHTNFHDLVLLLFPLAYVFTRVAHYRYISILATVLIVVQILLLSIMYPRMLLVL